MKKLFFLPLAVFMFTACETPKPAVTVISNDEAPVEISPETKENAQYAIGQVFINKDGCPIVVQLENSGMLLYPIALDEVFQVDKAWLQFYFEFSRAPQPRECTDAMPASLSQIVRLKR
jgi:hypothetical protein